MDGLVGGFWLRLAWLGHLVEVLFIVSEDLFG